MADTMSFQQYMDNPSKGAAVVTNKEGIKKQYRQKFDALMVRENGAITHIVFKDKDAHDSYYVYLKIPSESVSGLYYDVVVRMFTTENPKKAQTDLRHYAVQFYSNDPAFTYTFAYAFYKNKMLIKEFSRGLEKAPVKNPKNDVWYVKSLVFAYYAMSKFGLFNRSTLDAKALKYNSNDLKKLVSTPDKKMQDRKEQETKLKDLGRKQKQKEQETKRDTGRDVHQTKTAKMVGTVKNTKTTRATKATKVTKTTSAKLTH